MSDCETNFLNGGGQLGELIAKFDWSKTSLGPISAWPASVKIIVGNILRSNMPLLTMWGDRGILIYNDAYAKFSGERHPGLLGAPVHDAWPEIAPLSDHVLDRVYKAGRSISLRDEKMFLNRHGTLEAGYLDLDYSPIIDTEGRSLGMLVMVVETTDKVLSARHLRDERERLDQMYAQAPNFMALLEGPDHRFTVVNPAYKQVIGHRDVLGKTVEETLTDAVEQGYLALLDQVYESGEAYSAEGARYGMQALPGGPIIERFVDFVFQPIRNEAGEVTGIFIDGVDVTDRVTAQNEIVASAEQFRTFAQSVPNHVWTAPPSGEIRWFNDRILEYSGLSADKLRDDGWATILHPEDHRQADAAWKAAVASGSTYETEFRILRHDGEYRWHLSRATPIRAENGRILHWLGSNTDIHDRKIIETETARDRDRMWLLTQDLLVVYDLEGRIVTVNPSGERILGWPESEMLGRSITDFIHPLDRPLTEARLYRLRNGAAALNFESRIREHSGRYRVFMWSVVRDQGKIHAAGRDVTEERSLIRDRERIWKLSPVVKLVLKLDATIISVNPSWSRLLGWREDETINRNALFFLRDQPEQAAAHARLETLANGVDLIEHDAIFRTKDGGYRILAITSVRDEDTIYTFGRDVTTEREAANALVATEEALRQAQKMEAVGQLTGGIAHDFNNLLQGISGSLEIIDHRLQQGRVEDVGRFLTGATAAANRAASLTHRLLAFSRRQPLDPRAVRANPLISSMEDLLIRTMGEMIEIEMALAQDLWRTLCDPNQLENALLNLAINARDAMPNGGKLTIKTFNEHVAQYSPSSAPNVQTGDYVCIAVTDTGIGMDQDTIKKAFDPFFTTKPIGQGTGLGLSMIYGFAHQSDGYAKIDSALQEGTTFRLYLPRYEGNIKDEPPRAQAAKTLESKGGEAILVVEDEPIVRNLITEALAELGYIVIEAKDGQQGLETLHSDAPIDLLITDIGLPGINGREMVDRSRKARPDLKILFMTGYAENAAMASGFLEPGMMMITKPFAMHEFSERIRALLDS